MTQNLGILPINLGPAKLQRTDHTLVHYYTLKPLYDEFSTLNSKYNHIRLSYQNNSLILREISSYEKMVRFTQSKIISKIEYIQSTKSNINRRRRGLLNGLGSIIKGLTGNLDSEDGDKIFKILNHLQHNENNLMSQVQNQYSLSHSLIQNFNDNIKDIQNNELTLKLKIMQLNNIMKEGATQQNIISITDLYQQLLILYNLILNSLQEIENSITFCKMGILHPSIIKTKELFSELEKIQSHYKEQFPFELKFENILEFENIINVNCKLDPDKITYFLSVPIDYIDNFDLYYLLPIPSKFESEFVTIIPNNRYFLKSKNDQTVKALNDRCTQSTPHQCSRKLQSNSITSCEQNIILHQNSSLCSFTKVNIIRNHMETIPELGQYLAVFPREEKLQIQCQSGAETKALQGIFLIKEEMCKIFFKNNELPFQQKSYGKPLVLNSPVLDIKSEKLPKFNIELKKLNFQEMTPNLVSPILEDSPAEHLYIPSCWTMILYIIIVSTIVYVAISRRNSIKRIKSRTPDKSMEEKPSEQSIPLQKLSLPGGAPF